MSSECHKPQAGTGCSIWLAPLRVSPWTVQGSREDEVCRQGPPLHTSGFRRLLASSISLLPLCAAGQSWLPSQLQLFLPAGFNRPGPIPAQKQLHSCKWILQLPVLNNHVLFLCTINQLLPSTLRWLQAQGGALEERWWYIKLR